MRRWLIKFIRLYQIVLAPFFGFNCRFYPSCSTYAVEAINEYGVLKGFIKTIFRILCCNPFSKGGYDPIETKECILRRCMK